MAKYITFCIKILEYVLTKGVWCNNYNREILLNDLAFVDRVTEKKVDKNKQNYRVWGLESPRIILTDCFYTQIWFISATFEPEVWSGRILSKRWSCCGCSYVCAKLTDFMRLKLEELDVVALISNKIALRATRAVKWLHYYVRNSQKGCSYESGTSEDPSI